MTHFSFYTFIGPKHFQSDFFVVAGFGYYCLHPECSNLEYNVFVPLLSIHLMYPEEPSVSLSKIFQNQ